MHLDMLGLLVMKMVAIVVVRVDMRMPFLNAAIGKFNK